MEIDHQLLDKLRSAASRAGSTSIGLAHEIVAATQFLAGLYNAERVAESRLRAWPNDPRRAGMTPEQRNGALLASDADQRQLRQAERVAGRPPINEHARAAERAGIDVGTAAEVYARASAGADRQAAQSAWEAAVSARVRGEKQLRELEAERSRHGRRAGALGQTIRDAEAWLAKNGMATEAAA